MKNKEIKDFMYWEAVLNSERDTAKSAVRAFCEYQKQKTEKKEYNIFSGYGENAPFVDSDCHIAEATLDSSKIFQSISQLISYVRMLDEIRFNYEGSDKSALYDIEDFICERIIEIQTFLKKGLDNDWLKYYRLPR